MTDAPLCKDCKHFLEEYRTVGIWPFRKKIDRHKCADLPIVRERVDLVTGHVSLPLHAFCVNVREGGPCGPSGNLFEPKS